MNHRSIPFLLALIVFSIVSSSSEALQSQVDDIEKPSESATTNEKSEEKDNFRKIVDVSRKYFSLTAKDKKLSLKHPDQPEAQSLFNELAAQRILRGGSSTRGGDTWGQSSTGSDYSMSMGAGRYARMYINRVASTVANSDFVLRLNEQKWPCRKLEFISKSEFEYSIESAGGLGDGFFRLEHQEDGKILIQDFTDEIPMVVGAASFTSLWQQHPEYVDGPLREKLAQIGFKVPPATQGSEIKSQLIAQLKSTSEKWNSFKEMIERLDSNEYQVRSETQNELEKNFESWMEEIRLGINSDEVSLTAKAALKKIMEKKGTEDQKQSSTIIEHLNLLDDPKVLIKLWSDHGDDELLVSNIIGRLKQVADPTKHEELGSDLDRWQKHFDKSPNASKGINLNYPSLSDVKTRLDDVAVQISYMAKLKVNDGKLRFDRDKWSQRFNGKTVSELVEKLRDDLEKNNLPESWLGEASDFELESYQYEHVFFDQIKKQFEETDNSERRTFVGSAATRYRKKSASVNRFVSLNDLEMELRKDSAPLNQTSNAQNRRNKDEQFFSFSIRTHSRPITRLQLVEHPECGFYLLITIDESASVLELRQDIDGECRGYVAHGGDCIALERGSGTEFFESNKTAFNEHFVPLLKRFGVDVSQSMSTSNEN